jgi:hypothetical protein
MTSPRGITSAAAIVATAVALASTVVASAEPREWDIGGYDQCKASYPYDRQADVGRWYDHLKYCCLKTGGVWDGAKCVSPPKDEPKDWRPPLDLPSGPLTPVVDLPPGVITQAP